MSALQTAIAAVTEGQDLSMEHSALALGEIMRGEASDARIAALLVGLRMKGECAEELAGCALAMRTYSIPVCPAQRLLVDTCGTGGDGANTFNVSTAAAFIAAGAGLSVAKHGNRAVSGRTGSADVMQALGVAIELDAPQMAQCIDETGIGFLYAPRLHPAMRHAAGVRRELGIRTLFNMLGPLTNPAGAKLQVIGAFSEEAAELIARVLSMLETGCALVVHSHDGLDEISIDSPTTIREVRGSSLRTYTIAPDALGIAGAPTCELAGGDAAFNALLIRRLLAGEVSARLDIALLNAAAAVYCAGLAEDIAEGLVLARRSIASGAALARLEALQRISTRLAAESTRAAEKGAA